MSQFTIKLGKEEVACKIIISDLVEIKYKGQAVLIRPSEKGWNQTGEKLSDATLQKIGKAIEKHLTDNTAQSPPRKKK